MPRTPKVFLQGKIYELCFRTEEGLPLVCTPYMRAIIEGILARALNMYAITVFHLVFMRNHSHMLVRIDDPEHLDDFVAYVKRELAHAINNLLGRRQHTVWQEGYDSVIILDAAKMIERITYLYLNPARAGCEETIANYPGVTSWSGLAQGKWVLKGRRIPREKITMLPRATLSLEAQEEFAKSLITESSVEYVYQVDPMDWVDSFESDLRIDKELLRKDLLRSIKREEQLLSAQRTTPVIGAHALRLQNIRQAHTPKKFGKRMWCFGSTKEIRLRYIAWRKMWLAVRAELKKSLPSSEFLRGLPPGFFAPGGFLRANLIPAFVPM